VFPPLELSVGFPTLAWYRVHLSMLLAMGAGIAALELYCCP
jgi:hypothetical protein